MKINIAILGYGYWGPNLVRNFAKFKNINISYIVDKDINKLKEAKKLYPNAKCIQDPLIAIKDKNINAIVIALPVSQHYKYAKLALENNKHVLIEKPATDSKDKLIKLINIAKKNKLIFMIDYTFLYSPAFRKVKEIIDSGIIGNILFINSQRSNSGILRKDVNVIWDLAVHDISMIQYILNKKPKSINIKGLACINPKIVDLVYIVLKYNSKQMIHIGSSWLLPIKTKKMILCGTKKIIIYDDIEPINKIKIYDKKYHDSFNNNKYNSNKVYIPKISNKEPLHEMCKEFLNSIKYRKQTLINNDFYIKTTSILEICNKLIYNQLAIVKKKKTKK